MDILQTSLSWDPASRNKATLLLNKPYFASWRSGEDEAVCPKVSAGLISLLQIWAYFSLHFLTSVRITLQYHDNLFVRVLSDVYRKV